MTDLIERLRNQADRRHGSVDSLRSLEWQAADALEAATAREAELSRQLFALRAEVELDHLKEMQELVAERDAMARQSLSSSNQAAKAVYEKRQLVAQVEALTAENERLRELLARNIDDEPCHRDHHGYCQSHYLEEDCSVAAARAALEAE